MPNQMLSRLPISLAQLKAGNNSQESLKMKLGNYYIPCTDQKRLKKFDQHNLKIVRLMNRIDLNQI